MKLYILTYNFYDPQGGSYKYAVNPKVNQQHIIYDKKEREDFITRWEELLKDDMKYDNIKTYYIDLSQPIIAIDITDQLKQLKESI